MSHTRRSTDGRVTPSRPPGRAGSWAAALSVVAVATLVASALLVNAFERRASGVMDVARPIMAVVFLASGIGALVLSIRSLVSGERGAVVWAAFVVGLLASLLVLAEFTILE